jgi:hypothetical protein
MGKGVVVSKIAFIKPLFALMGVAVRIGTPLI